MVLYPVAAVANIQVLVSVVFDKELYQEPAILQTAWMLLEGFLEVHLDYSPFLPCLTPFLGVCNEVKLVF
jgi:hypothetical protein